MPQLIQNKTHTQNIIIYESKLKEETKVQLFKLIKTLINCFTLISGRKNHK